MDHNYYSFGDWFSEEVFVLQDNLINTIKTSVAKARTEVKKANQIASGSLLDRMVRDIYATAFEEIDRQFNGD
jgi:hypothetical protein